MLRLIIPDLEFSATYLAGMREIIGDCPDLAADYSVVDIPDQIERWKSLAQTSEEARFQYWLMDNDEFIGTVQIRKATSGRIPETSSNIGYFLKPSREDEPTLIRLFELTVEEARILGIRQLVVACGEGDYCIETLIKQMESDLLTSATLVNSGQRVNRYSIQL
ncbi:MAG: hypothetical protein ACR2IE_18010 [Candidatus Sumerlaeaceae bacterium]